VRAPCNMRRGRWDIGVWRGLVARWHGGLRSLEGPSVSFLLIEGFFISCLAGVERILVHPISAGTRLHNRIALSR